MQDAPSTAQIRAGRALLGWPLKTLAFHAGFTVARASRDERDASPSRAYLAKILTEHGVRFIPGGVVLS